MGPRVTEHCSIDGMGEYALRLGDYVYSDWVYVCIYTDGLWRPVDDIAMVAQYQIRLSSYEGRKIRKILRREPR